MEPIINGKYRHFKGNEYQVIGVAKHSETMEELVVYRALYGEKGLWVRPKAMFLEKVMVGGALVNRFQLVEEDTASAGESSCRNVCEEYPPKRE